MIFKPAARYPADPRAVFILALSVFSGATALALKTGPESLESLLPAWGVILWGVILGLGSAVTLTGMAFQTVNGIIAEQIGSVMVGAATVFYSGLAFWFIGFSAVQTVGIVLAWGLACFARWGQLQSLINDAVKRKAKIELLARVEAEIVERQERAKAERENRKHTHWGL
jgi:hypothetical protein